MESNKDEASRCFELAKKYRLEGNIEKCEKFLQKSLKLYPMKQVEEYLNDLPKISQKQPETPRAQNPSSPASSSTTKEKSNDQGQVKKEYSSEQLKSVQRILSCSTHSYYEILGIPKDSTEAEIKKAYKKLALQLHPDKNSAPRADEAFKMLSRAFSVLSDAEKRKSFDRFGVPNSTPTPSTNHFYNGRTPTTFAFDDDINAEEIFNMFFGHSFGQFPNGHFQQGMRQRFRTHRAAPRRPPPRNEPLNTNMETVIRFLPLLVLFLFTFIGSFIGHQSQDPEPTFTFSPTSQYSTLRHTYFRKIPYYVSNDSLSKEFFTSPKNPPPNHLQSKLKKFEDGVEIYYLKHLQKACEIEVDDRNNAVLALKKSFYLNPLQWLHYDEFREDVKRLESKTLPKCERLRSFRK